LKSLRIALLQGVKELQDHALSAHFHDRSFKQLIFALQTKHVPMLNVVQNWFVFPLFCVAQLNNTESSLSVVQPVRELLLHLPPTIVGFRFQVGIPVKGDTFQHPEELLYHQVAIRANIVAYLDEMCNTLF